MIIEMHVPNTCNSLLWFLLVSLQLDSGALTTSDVPHDYGVVWAAGEQHPLDRVPAQRRHITWRKEQHGVEGWKGGEVVGGQIC